MSLEIMWGRKTAYLLMSTLTRSVSNILTARTAFMHCCWKPLRIFEFLFVAPVPLISRSLPEDVCRTVLPIFFHFFLCVLDGFGEALEFGSTVRDASWAYEPYILGIEEIAWSMAELVRGRVEEPCLLRGGGGIAEEESKRKRR